MTLSAAKEGLYCALLPWSYVITGMRHLRVSWLQDDVYTGHTVLCPRLPCPIQSACFLNTLCRSLGPGQAGRDGRFRTSGVAYKRSNASQQQ